MVTTMEDGALCDGKYSYSIYNFRGAPSEKLITISVHM
jgi:hypothetical protein